MPREDIVSAKAINWGMRLASQVSTNIVRMFYRERVQAEETLEADKNKIITNVEAKTVGFTRRRVRLLEKEKKQTTRTRRMR